MNNLKTHKYSIIYLTIAYLIPFIIQAVLFGYQVSKGIVSIWNIMSVVMIIFLYGFAFKRVRHANINGEERIERRKEDFEKVKQELSKKVTKKTRIIVFLVAVAAAGLSVLFHHLYATKTEGLELVNSKVVDQWGETTVVTEETDEGIEQTESDYIEVSVEYEFNGETKGAVIKATTTNKIYVDELKIFVDAEGKFVADYGRLAVWKFESIAFFSFACFMLFCAILGLGTEFIGGAAFMVIGTAFMFIVASPLFENFLFNDMTCFTLLFANVGVCLILTGLLCLIFGKYAVYGLYNTDLEYVPTEPVEDMYYNNAQGSHSNDIIELCCDNCGEPIGENDKFCGNCGKKLND